MNNLSPRGTGALWAYAVVTTSLLIVLAITAFRHSSRPRFEEIDVERINVIEKDGTLRMTISSHGRIPDPVIGGKSYPLRNATGAEAGMIFFNEEGNEDGGLIFSGRRTPGGHEAGASLTFDQFNQDQTVALSYADHNGKRRAGLQISDRGEESIQAGAESLMVYRRLPDGPDKVRRTRDFRASAQGRGLRSIERMYAGKGVNKEAIVSLSDSEGRARILMAVDSAGVPRLDFLDERGNVTSHLPAAQNTGKIR